MKRKLLLICISLFFYTSYSQENEEKITLKAVNLTQIEVLQLIEENSNYQFYFLEEWFSKKTFSISYEDVKIEKILDEIFESSTINYFIMEGSKIILTKGNLIKRSIYENIDRNTQTDAPIFVNSSSDFKNEYIKIGKETDFKKDRYTLSGTVTNDKTGKPIEGVTVISSNKNNYTTTDKNGKFQLTLPYGKNEIETIFSGFEGEFQKLIIYNNGTLNLSISESSEQLDEVIINANKTQNVRQTIAGISSIKAKDIKTIPTILGERDILKVAITLPSIKSAGEGSEGVNVRGGKVDQNLFLLDNGVIYNPTHFLGLFSAINPFTTKDLKAYAGNIPAEYGGRLSSVFDIKTNDPNTKKLSGEASIGPVTGNVNLDIPIINNTSGLILGGRSTYSGWILDLVDNKDIQNSSVSFFDVIGKYKHKINENNNIKITGYHSKDQYQIASDTINEYGNTLVTLNWNHKFNSKNTGDLTLSNSNYTFNIDYEGGDTNKGFNLKYRINETDLKFLMKYNYSTTHKFKYGLESKLYSINPGSIIPNGENSEIIPLNIPQEKALENSLFVLDEIKVNKKLNFNLGLRLNQFLALGPSSERIYENGVPKNESTLLNTVNHDNNAIYKTYHNLSYRISGRYSFDDSFSVKAGYNKSFQYIHRLNNNTTATPIDTWRLSDANIKPQEGSQLSLGFFKNLEEDTYEFSLEGYFKEYNNLLDYKIGANLLLNENIETEIIQGKGKSYGVEFLFRKNSGRLNGWLGYSYSRSLIQLDSEFDEERVNNGVFFPTNYDIPHDLNAVLNYKFTKRYSLSVNFTYQTGKPITYPTGKYIIDDIEFLTYSNRNQFRIPDYYRMDVGINIEGNHKIKKFAHSFWNISIYNVLGRNNPYSVFFESVNGNVQSYQNSIFSVPIPTITYNFKF
ncbi:TonB-dependent receptor [uncultured Tenacibaculum sp.]|uniref:TonB-dependent receptor n=1 Tax=uncultured Tenacibaculum sp. TaxID=174713 RepID=UPI002625C53F|nr:TonB-dependent receptor [uncultured Tenacibaculum sp.]